MKRWQKFALLAATPTVTALHERSIAHLLGLEWANIEGFIKVMGVLFVSACVIGLTFASESP